MYSYHVLAACTRSSMYSQCVLVANTRIVSASFTSTVACEGLGGCSDSNTRKMSVQTPGAPVRGGAGQREMRTPPGRVRQRLSKPASAVGRGTHTLPHLISPHLTSPRITSHHLTSSHLTSPHLTSPHLASHHITSPHLTSPRITSHHLT